MCCRKKGNVNCVAQGGVDVDVDVDVEVEVEVVQVVPQRSAEFSAAWTEPIRLHPVHAAGPRTGQSGTTTARLRPWCAHASSTRLSG